MKFLNYTMVIMFLFSSSISPAQEEKEMKYIFGKKGKTKVSGFGAPIMQFSAIGEEFAFIMGGGGAVLLDQTFYFGGFGEGLTTQHYTEIEDKNDYPYRGQISFGYGGLWLGYIHKSQKPVHFGLSSRVAWGSIYFDQYYHDSDHEYYYDPAFNDNVFVFIPQAEAEFNFFKWMKINIGVGYRVVTGIDKEYMGKQMFDKKDFNKPQATLTLLFGSFK